VWNALSRVVKGQQTSGQIGPGGAGEFEHDRLSPPFDPNFARNNSLHAIINLTAYDTVVNAKSHKIGRSVPWFRMDMAEIQPERKAVQHRISKA
jgi:hypothetical protein